MATYGELMDAGEFFAGTLCPECISMLVNGENTATNGEESDWDAAKYQETIREWDITRGHVCSGEWADSSCWHEGVECRDIFCNCDFRMHSREECSACGDTKHGERHDVTMIRREHLNSDYVVGRSGDGE